MNENDQLGYSIRQALNRSTEALSPVIADRLHEARQKALAVQRVAVTRPRFAVAGFDLNLSVAPPVRAALFAMALSIGAAGAYYWHQFEQALEHEVVDSELLSDELPPSIYLDQGFEEWFDFDSNDSP